MKEIQNELRQQRLEQEAKERYDHDRIKENEERKQVARERESLEKEKRQMFSEVKSVSWVSSNVRFLQGILTRSNVSTWDSFMQFCYHDGC